MIRRASLGSVGSCPVVDLENNICDLGGMEVACNLIRECDHLTGAVHFEYALPQGNVNPNIWVIQGDGTSQWNGPAAPNVPAPIVPPPPPITSFTPAPLTPNPAPVVPVAPPPPGSNSFPAMTTPLNPRLSDPLRNLIPGNNPAATVTTSTSTSVVVTGGRVPNTPNQPYELSCTAIGCQPGEPGYPQGGQEPAPESSFALVTDYASQVLDQAKQLPWWVWAAAAGALYLSTRKK